jgi:transcriptional regulator with XRE-family HTH domain
LPFWVLSWYAGDALKASKNSDIGPPKSEADVGRRLKDARERLALTQQAFADQLGITKKRLASYEELRVGLRYDLALRICRQFIISEKWLATGKGNWRALMDLSSDPVVNRVAIDEPFRRAYTTHLSSVYEQLCSRNNGQIQIRLNEGENEHFIVNLFLYFLDYWVSSLRREDRARFLTQLMDFGSTLLDSYAKHGALPDVHGFGQANVFEKALLPNRDVLEKPTK